MTWVVPLALGGLAILVMVTFTMLSARRRHHATIAPAQVIGPRVLVHDINDDRCTGCDACVAVCPTNVLDLVANKSRVLRFHDCIQCEQCMFVCPTEALVMFPEGAVPPPLKIPEIDENFQTAVPGQYLIGEVAGKPLVKNAANLGRSVIEHMLTTGLYPGALGPATESVVDVVIVGSGPGGLSAALTCIQKGLSYVVLEKEQDVASTIARYPKGKLVMAEPYDTENLSFLPVFDSSKEQLIPIWKELIDRVQLRILKGESVEAIQKTGSGSFETRTTVATYHSQRVVLSIGTRGKPRTLNVPGENLPKIFSLLEDPDMWTGRSVLVVGGGDSACEAALALADSGAKVIISYRGKGFNRAAPKNKSAIERYAAEGRIKAKLGSQVLQFEPDSVTMALGDGSQKRYPNDAAFVLIGADPPVAWLEKVGIHFVERPHQFQFGKSDDIVRRFVARAAECPEDAARAAAQILGGSTGLEPSRAAAVASLPMPMGGDSVRGPKKWLRSATSIFSTRGNSVVSQMPKPDRDKSGVGKSKKLDAPMPLSEFAKRQRTQGHGHKDGHTGHGRRDQLTAGERTRILRMLRDEGGRIADEESQVHIGAAPAAKYDFDFDDEAAPPPPPSSQLRADVPAKPALVVGLAQARNKRQTGGPQLTHPRTKPATQAPPAPQPAPQRTAPPPVPRGKSPTAPPPVPGGARPAARKPLPNPFNEATRAMQDEELLAAVRAAPGPGRVAPARGPDRGSLFDEPTRMGDIDSHLIESTRRPDAEITSRDNPPSAPEAEYPPKFLPANTELSAPIFTSNDRFDSQEEEATRMANVDGSMPPKRTRGPSRLPPPSGRTAPNKNDERTRAVDIRNDPSISDIDWDID